MFFTKVQQQCWQILLIVNNVVYTWIIKRELYFFFFFYIHLFKRFYQRILYCGIKFYLCTVLLCGFTQIFLLSECSFHTHLGPICTFLNVHTHHTHNWRVRILDEIGHICISHWLQWKHISMCYSSVNKANHYKTH